MKNNNNEPQFVPYLLTFSEDIGIYQHSIYGIPALEKGFTTDDNARALIVAVMLYEKFHQKKYLDLINKYLAFLLYAQNKNGRFKNFMNLQREFLEEEGSEDCFGRCIWALGYTLASKAVPENIRRSSRYALDILLKQWTDLNSPRAKAYAIVGLAYVSEEPSVVARIEELSSSLADQYAKFRQGDWHWFEDSMTYGNSFFPWAMLCAFHVLDKKNLLEIAEESMEFLEKTTIREEFFKPIGCNGWLTKGGNAAEYDEQPLEACEMVLCSLEFYKRLKDKHYLVNAEKCFRWYQGCNSKRQSLLDKDTGACYDGLCENEINLNQGSESIVSFGIAYMEISNYIENVSDYEIKPESANMTKKEQN